MAGVDPLRHSASQTNNPRLTRSNPSMSNSTWVICGAAGRGRRCGGGGEGGRAGDAPGCLLACASLMSSFRAHTWPILASLPILARGPLHTGVKPRVDAEQKRGTCVSARIRPADHVAASISRPAAACAAPAIWRAFSQRALL